MMGLQREDLEAYDSKAEPVADATAALVTMNNAGWVLVRKYFPALGTESTEAEKRLHPEDPTNNRFLANHANEDATSSPVPLLSAVASLPATGLSGHLKSLHDEMAPAMVREDYFAWKLDDLRKAVEGMTNPMKTAQGVKYRTPKPSLSFVQAVQLYAMTIALVRIETKWTDKADSPPPDMTDFTNRLRHQLPRQIGDGEIAAFFLYRPNVIGHPLSKQECEERADVVVVKRKGTSFEMEQFPVYLTSDQKEWNPSWIELRDESVDTTLTARKFEHDWTRFDGPYLWFRGDQLNGQVVYTATVKFQRDSIVIEAERSIESRGAVKRVDRAADYDPSHITAFVPGIDTPATGLDVLAVDPPRLDDEVRNLKRLGPYFPNGFRAWCAYGLWTSGLAADGKTWVGVPAEEPRPGGPKGGPSTSATEASATKAAAQP